MLVELPKINGGSIIVNTDNIVEIHEGKWQPTGADCTWITMDRGGRASTAIDLSYGEVASMLRTQGVLKIDADHKPTRRRKNASRNT